MKLDGPPVIRARKVAESAGTIDVRARAAELDSVKGIEEVCGQLNHSPNFTEGYFKVFTQAVASSLTGQATLR